MPLRNLAIPKNVKPLQRKEALNANDNGRPSYSAGFIVVADEIDGLVDALVRNV